MLDAIAARYQKPAIADVARHVGEDVADVESVLSDVNIKSWADMLAVLENENYHRLYAECQNRMKVPEEAVTTALHARYGY